MDRTFRLPDADQTRASYLVSPKHRSCHSSTHDQDKLLPMYQVYLNVAHNSILMFVVTIRLPPERQVFAPQRRLRIVYARTISNGDPVGVVEWGRGRESVGCSERQSGTRGSLWGIREVLHGFILRARCPIARKCGRKGVTESSFDNEPTFGGGVCSPGVFSRERTTDGLKHALLM